MSGKTNPGSSDSAGSAWVVLENGGRINLADILYFMRVPQQTVDVDAEKDNTVALSSPIRGFRVGGSGGGDVTVRFAGDTEDRTISNVQPGEFIQGRITHVRDTGTTATGILGFV